MHAEHLKRDRDAAAARPANTVNSEVLNRDLRERLKRSRSQISWGDGTGIALATLLAGYFSVKGIWASQDGGGLLTLGSMAMFTLALGAVFLVVFTLGSRRRQKKRELEFEDSAKGNLQRLLSTSNYQIGLRRSALWWNLFPFMPGMLLLVADWYSEMGSRALMPGLFIFSVFGFVYWLNQWSVRKQLIPQRKELEELLAKLEMSGGGEAAGLPPELPRLNLLQGNAKERRRAWVVTAVCFGLAGALMFAFFRPPQEPRAPEFDDVSAFGAGEVARIDAWLQKQVERSGYPSLSVAIVHDGKTVYQRAFGYENTWAERKATTNTVYHVASVTKAFTASLAVLLEARGIVDLDEPAMKYLPAGAAISTEPEMGAKITLRQLASHTSGLPRGIPGRVQTVEGHYQLEPERLYELLPKVKLQSEPGTSELYSNLGFGLLGHVLELAAGKPLDKLLQEWVCEPLTLERTAIHVDERLQIATGYGTAPRLPEGHSYQERLAGSGGLVTSVGDLAKFLAAQMEPGLFTSEMLAELHSETRLLDGSLVDTALGWSVRTNEFAGRIVKKNGGRNNCGAWIGFAPEHGVGVAVATNSGEPDVDPIGYWLLERAIPGGRKPVTRHGYAKVAPYTGVRWENDRPIVRVQGRWLRVVSIDGLPIDRIMEFARKEFGNKARKRFAEDLVELLARLGHEPDWEVALELETEAGQVEQLQVRMTEENRALMRE